MKYFIFILSMLGAILMPISAFATCSTTGSTVVYINGILTSEIDARKDKNTLESDFIYISGRTDVKFTNGYNPSHLGGVGDLVESVSQAKGAPVSNFDRDTILMQIYPEVATRKILLVGHSQGTFYANEIYDYFIKHGESKDSVGVYNVATPASFVAGGGDYLTSSSDKVINAARSAAATKFGIALGAGQPLPANISIPLTEQEAADSNGGHSFSGVYLAGAAGRIISEIDASLKKLSAENVFSSPDAGCFAPPPENFSYLTQKIAFAAADNIAGGAVFAGSAYAKTIALAVDGVKNAATAILSLGQKNAPPKTTPQVAEKPKSVPQPSLGAKPPSAPLPTLGVGTSKPNLDVRRPSESVPPLPSLPPPANLPSTPPPFLQLQSVGGGGTPGFGGGASAPISPPVPANSAVETPTETPEPPDTTAPDISLSVSECASSLSSDGCLLASSTASVFWSSSAGDLNHYILECETGGAACSGFNFASTTATSTIFTLPADDATYIFKAKAVDNAGNESQQATKTISLSTRPVVINEIAWAGTAASANDEWIELYNRSGKSVNLANWVLYAEDGVPYINLSGSVAAGGYYLIERTDDNTVSDVAADLVAPFSGLGAGSGLGNSGEILVLSHASTTIDRTPNCGANWISCGGAASGAYPTMERIDPEVAGTDTTNWGTSNGIVKNGLDSAGAALTATPRARNSLHYLISQTGALLADKTLKKFWGTYIIRPSESFTVPTGKTLTIEPGVTVKIGSDSKLLVDGVLTANGSADAKIIFTALESSAWETIKISSLGAGSSISYADFNGGGRFFSNTPMEERAELGIVGNGTPVSHSTFQNSLSAGLRLTSSGASVSANTFSVGTTTADNAGVYIVGGAPSVSGNTFSENYFGAKAEGAAASFADNIFNNNISYAVSSSNGSSAFSGNSGAGNGKNGIALSGNIAAAGATTTLSANALPYVTRAAPYYNAIVPAGAGVEINAGVKIAGEDSDSPFTINGTLKLNGASAGDIIFTSLSDSAPGEWAGILLNTGGYAYGGGFTLRYGGGGNACRPNCAGFRVIGGSADLQNGLIQNNYLAGMRFLGAATSTLDNFEFSGHQTPTGDSTGLVSVSSPLTLTNLIFSNNYANTFPASLY